MGLRSGNLHNGLVERACAAVMDRAYDISGLEDGQRLGLDPVNHSDAIIRKLSAKDLGEHAFGRKDGVLSLLLKFPQDLKPLLLGVLVETVDGRLEGLRHLHGLRLRDFDQSSHVDEDRLSVGKPLGQLGVGPIEGSVGSNHRSAGDDVGRDLERIVQLGKAADEDLDVLGAVLNQVNRGSDDAVRVEVRLNILSLIVLLEGPNLGEGIPKVERNLVPLHRKREAREKARQNRQSYVSACKDESLPHVTYAGNFQSPAARGCEETANSLMEVGPRQMNLVPTS